MHFVGAAVLGAGFTLCASMAALAYLGPNRLPPWLGGFLQWASGERVSGRDTSVAIFFGACAFAILVAEVADLVREFNYPGPRAALGVIVILLEACWLVYLRSSLRAPASDAVHAA